MGVGRPFLSKRHYNNCVFKVNAARPEFNNQLHRLYIRI